MLCQKIEDNKERAIYYLSNTVIDYEIRYTLMKKICFVMIFTTKKFRYYLLYFTTYVVHHVNPLRYLVAKQYLSNRFIKWLMLLHEFDINVVEKKLIK